MFAAAAGAAEPARVTLEVPSMNCSLCPIAVADVLRKQPGVQQATADLASKSAQVVCDCCVYCSFGSVPCPPKQGQSCCP